MSQSSGVEKKQLLGVAREGKVFGGRRLEVLVICLNECDPCYTMLLLVGIRRQAKYPIGIRALNC